MTLISTPSKRTPISFSHASLKPSGQAEDPCHNKRRIPNVLAIFFSDYYVPGRGVTLFRSDVERPRLSSPEDSSRSPLPYPRYALMTTAIPASMICDSREQDIRKRASGSAKSIMLQYPLREMYYLHTDAHLCRESAVLHHAPFEKVIE